MLGLGDPAVVRDFEAGGGLDHGRAMTAIGLSALPGQVENVTFAVDVERHAVGVHDPCAAKRLARKLGDGRPLHEEPHARKTDVVSVEVLLAGENLAAEGG